MKVDEFSKFKFTILRGENKDIYVVSLADLPIMIPHDWIVLYGILKKHESKFRLHLFHVTRMIINYCMEGSKMDVEVSKHVKRNPTAKPKEQPTGLETMRE